MKVALYAWARPDCNEELDFEVSAMTGFAEACGWEVRHTYLDCGLGAGLPGWKRMLSDGDTGMFDVLLMWGGGLFGDPAGREMVSQHLSARRVSHLWIVGSCGADDSGVWLVAEGVARFSQLKMMRKVGGRHREDPGL